MQSKNSQFLKEFWRKRATLLNLAHRYLEFVSRVEINLNKYAKLRKFLHVWCQ